MYVLVVNDNYLHKLIATCFKYIKQHQFILIRYIVQYNFHLLGLSLAPIDTINNSILNPSHYIYMVIISHLPFVSSGGV